MAARSDPACPTLENPPEYERTHCSRCGAVIVMADGGYSMTSEGYLCGKCSAQDIPPFMRKVFGQ